MTTHHFFRLTRRLAVMAALITILGGCHGRPLPWVDVSPAGAGFKVQMPGNPSMTTKSAPTAFGTVSAQI
jgi:hypothetical protein